MLNQGNQFFKKEKYDMAIERYSQGLEIDSENVLLLLNRAMALLKQEKWAVGCVIGLCSCHGDSCWVAMVIDFHDCCCGDLFLCLSYHTAWVSIHNIFTIVTKSDAPWIGGSFMSLGLGQPWPCLDLLPLLLLLFGIAFHLQLVLLSYHPICLRPNHFLKLVSFLGANRTKSASVCLWLLRGAI